MLNNNNKGGELCSMLQAKTKDGHLVTLATLTREEIQRQRNNSFFCPMCNQPVIVKAGTQVIPHFAHRSNKQCSTFKGGEGPYHKKGKLYLYLWLKSQGLHVRLEPFLETINQQPDLLISFKHKKIAIEFQCARIPSHEIRQRNEGYRQANIHPLWILGATRFKRQAQNKMRIDQLTRQFIHQFSSDFPQTLFYFCPHSLQFAIFQHIYFTRANEAIGQLKFLKLNKLTFTDIFQVQPHSVRNIFQQWVEEKKRFRLQRRHRLYGQDLSWQRWLYARNTHVNYLPSIIYLPVATQYLMKSPPWDWQSRLCIDILKPLRIGSVFSIQKCMQYLNRYVHDPHKFSLIKSAKHPIRQYLQLLEKLDIITRQSNNYFRKINDFHFHTHVEEALVHDKRIMQDLITKSK